MGLSLGGTPRKRVRTTDTVRESFAYVSGTLTSHPVHTFRDGETTIDENHGRRRRLLAQAQAGGALLNVDTGGPFTNEKLTYWDNARVYNGRSGIYSCSAYQLPVSGTLVDRNFGSGVYWAPTVTASSLSELNSFGATAISRCSPANPHSQVLTSIGELYRDGLPAATGVKTIRDHDVGAEFLNYQFGIAPLLSDLQSLHKSLSQSEKIVAQYLRDSGRKVRRRYELPVSIETTVVTSTGPTWIGSPSLTTNLYANTQSGATRRTTTTTTSRKWFSGSFTYHAELPDGTLSNMAQRVREYNHLYGLLPSPAVLWNLTPWSWAADWVANMGDILNNVSMFQNDGLVLNYGYVMEHKTITREHHLYGYSLASAGPVNTVQRFVSETKVRRKASPFGFGLTAEGFSNRQWAILVALGMTKGKGIAF